MDCYYARIQHKKKQHQKNPTKNQNQKTTKPKNATK